MKLTNLILNTDFFEGEIISINESEKQLSEIEGGGEKGLLIVIFRKEEAQIPFLEKVFSAIKMDLKKDLHLLKLEATSQFQLMELQKQLSFREVIFFGFDPRQCGLNLNWKSYHAINWNGLKLMTAEDLISLSGNENSKRALWNALKTWKE